MKINIQLSIFLIVVWIANINDLIRGNWYYQNIEQILFWNIIGVISLILLLYEKNK